MSGNNIKTMAQQIYNSVLYYYFNDPGKYSNGQYSYFKVADGAYEHLSGKSRSDQLELTIKLIDYIKQQHSSFFMHNVVVTYVRNNPKFIKDFVKILDFKDKDFMGISVEARAEKLLDIILTNSINAQLKQSQDVSYHSSTKTSDTNTSAKEQEESVTDPSASQLPPESIVPLTTNYNNKKQYEELKDAAEKTLALLMNLDGEINIAHVDALTNIMWEMNQQIVDENEALIDGKQLLEYHKAVKSILQEVVAKFSEVNGVKSNQKLTGLQQQVQEIVRPLQNGLDQMQQKAAVLQAQANTLFANKGTQHEHEQQPKVKNEVNMPTPITLPKPEDVLQDTINAFNSSTSLDRGGKKDYADVLFKVYQKHLEGKTPEQQKAILQGLIEEFKGRSTFQNVGLGIRNPLAAFKISRIIKDPNAPQWIKDIGNMSYDTPEAGAQQLYAKIHKQLNGMETPDGSVAIKSSGYNEFVKNYSADEKAPSLWNRIKEFFSNIFTSIKAMFGITSDVGPERILTPQQILEKEKEDLILDLNSLKIDSSEFKHIEITKRNSLAEKLGIRVAELIEHINKATKLDEFKLDVHKLNKDVAKLKDANLNQQDKRDLLSEYLPQPQSNPSPVESKKATMLSSIGTKVTSMEKGAGRLAGKVGSLFKSGKPQG